MSGQSFPTHSRTLHGAVLFALAAVSASAALGGSINLGTFEGTKAGFYNVTESGPSVPPSLYTPATPGYTELPDPQLSFAPQNFAQFVVETSGTTPFDLQYKTAQLSLPMVAKKLVGDPVSAGYEFTGLSLHLAGSYSVFAPYAGSQAKVTMAGQYTVQVTQVDWLPYAIANSYTAPFPVVPSSQTTVGPQDSAVSGSWEGNTSINWTALRAAAGLTATQHITAAIVQFTTDIGAASLQGVARTTVLNFNVNAPVAPVAVPEPPTVILAGLGAAAAVGHGYRRRRLRRGSDVDARHDGQDAIALTA